MNIRLLTIHLFLVLTMNKVAMAFVKVHKKCRNGIYPSTNVSRFPVSDDKVLWEIDFSEYMPPNYSLLSLDQKPWADLNIDDPEFNPKWNSIDGLVDRRSYKYTYQIRFDEYSKGIPLNPIGRTGLSGRGRLGRWGPNHAADPIVTKWKRNDKGAIIYNEKTLRPILQFIAILRADNKQWAFPGGMVDPGEDALTTACREFKEEATNYLQLSKESRSEMDNKFQMFFSQAVQVFQDYVDDSRNTDNAWIESSGINYHDESGETIARLPLTAGDETNDVQWCDVDCNTQLHASHLDMLQLVADLRKAHWSNDLV